MKRKRDGSAVNEGGFAFARGAAGAGGGGGAGMQQGLTKREYYAAAALTGMLASGQTYASIAAQAFYFADQMIDEGNIDDGTA